MKRKYKILLSILVVIVAFAIFYKWKQKQFLGLSEPQVETIESIISYAEEHNLKGDIFYAKDDESQEVLDKYFSFGMIYVIDSDSTLINANLTSMGGDCHQDIQDAICDGFPIAQREFDGVDGKMIIEKLFANSKAINSEHSWGEYKYTVIYSWVKYARACIDESSVRFIRCLENNPEVRLISVNTDMINYGE